MEPSYFWLGVGKCMTTNHMPACLFCKQMEEACGDNEEDNDGQIQKAVEETTVGILSVKRRISERPDIGIILEGQQVLVELDSVALATALLFGLMYALNLDYPEELKYTFEFLQKVIMELEGTTMSKKCQALQNKLRE